MKTTDSTHTEPDDVTAELWQQDRHGERLEMINRLNQVAEVIQDRPDVVQGKERRRILTKSIRDACGEIRALPDTIAEGEAERERLKIPIHVCLVDFQNQSPAVMMPTLKAGIDEVLAMLDQYAARTPDYYGSGEAEKNQLHPADGQAKSKQYPATPEGLQQLIRLIPGEKEQRLATTQAILAMYLIADKKGEPVDRAKMAACLGLKEKKKLEALKKQIHENGVSRPGESGDWNQIEVESYFQKGEFGSDVKELVEKLDLRAFTKRKSFKGD